MRYKMDEVAKLAGVSQSTVSRVLRGDKRISEKSANKVMAVVNEVNYQPNIPAQNLASGKSNTIGVVLNVKSKEDFANEFIARSIFGIEKVVQEQGFDLLIMNYEFDSNNERFKKLIYQNKVDGVIIPSSLVNDDILKLLNDSNIKFIVIGEPENALKEMDWIDIDNKQGAKIAVDYLSDFDVEEYLLIIEDQLKLYNKRRIEGFSDAVKVSNKKATILDQQNEEWAQLVKNNLTSKRIGIICGNNFIASKCLKIVKELKLSFGKDIFLITFDTYPLAEYLDPSLTSIDIDTYGLGVQVANELLKKIISNEPDAMNNNYIKNSIFIRDSTGGTHDSDS